MSELTAEEHERLVEIADEELKAITTKICDIEEEIEAIEDEIEVIEAGAENMAEAVEEKLKALKVKKRTACDEWSKLNAVAKEARAAAEARKKAEGARFEAAVQEWMKAIDARNANMSTDNIQAELFIYALVGPLINFGLPPLLNTHPRWVNLIHPPHPKKHTGANIIEKSFCLLQKDQYNVRQSTRSMLYTQYASKKLEYINLHCIGAFVSAVLEDAIRALPEVFDEKCLRVRKDVYAFAGYSDMWMLSSFELSSHEVPIGVAAIKDPATGILSSEALAGEVLDYMKHIRSSFGLRDVFCIASTYKEWRIFWLSDCDASAASPLVDSTSSQRPPSPQPKTMPTFPIWWHGEATASNAAYSTAPKAAPIPEEDRVVHAGKVMLWSDKDLVPTLLSVLVKMASSPAFGATREFVQVNETTWSWATLPPDFAVSANVAIPPGDPTSYTLLEKLSPDGEYGRAWLAATESGALCVIKFVREYSFGVDDEEAIVWKEAWQLDVRSLTLADRPALLLPYVWMCPKNGPDAAYAAQVREATGRAIERMAAAGWEHTNLRKPGRATEQGKPQWKHVGLYRENGELRALLISLGRVNKVGESREERAEAVARMRSALDLDA